MVTRLFAAFLLLAAVTSYPATYYVAVGGDDSSGSDGSELLPWRTLSKAITNATAGDDIVIEPGTHNEAGANLTVYSKNDGSLAAPIRIHGRYGIDEQLADVTGAKVSRLIRHRILATNSYLVFSDLVSCSSNYSGQVAFEFPNSSASTPAANNCVYSNLFVHGWYRGFQWKTTPDNLSGPSNTLIMSCIFSNFGYDGQVIMYGKSNVLQNCKFLFFNDFDSMNVSGINHIIRSNLFWEMRSGIEDTNSLHCDIIQSFGTTSASAPIKNVTSNVVIECNVITNCFKAQLFNLEANVCTNTMGWWIFRNNIVVGSRAQANMYFRNMYFYNNTFVSNGWWGSTVTKLQFKGYGTKGSGDYGRVYNNIFWNCAINPNDADSGFYDPPIFNTDITRTFCEADNNFIGPNKVANDETNGLRVNYSPGFVDEARGDFRLVSTSACINAGIDLTSKGVTKDMAGNARPLGGVFDIGAFEFVAPSTEPTMYLTGVDVYVYCTNGLDADDVSYGIGNSGTNGFSFTVTTNQTWVSASPVSGNVTNEVVPVVLSFATSALAVGVHSAYVTNSSPTALGSPKIFHVILTVYSGNSPEGVMSLDGNSVLSYTATEGIPSDGGNYILLNTGNTAYSVDVSTDSSWLTLELTGATVNPGSEQAIPFLFSTESLGVGVYESYITNLSDGTLGSPIVVTVRMDVQPNNPLTSSRLSGKIKSGGKISVK